MNWDIIQTLLRSVLKVAGGALIAKGFTDDAGVEALTGAIITIGGVIWGYYHRKPSAPQANENKDTK